MADGVQCDICSETGIGCVMVEQAAGRLKIDLMPDEVATLRDLLRLGDFDGARELLASVDSKAGPAMDDARLKELAGEMG